METTGEEGRIQGTEGVVGGLQPLGYITTPRGYIQVENETEKNIQEYTGIYKNINVPTGIYRYIQEYTGT